MIEDETGLVGMHNLGIAGAYLLVSNKNLPAYQLLKKV
jgi:hypothetical protein